MRFVLVQKYSRNKNAFNYNEIRESLNFAVFFYHYIIVCFGNFLVLVLVIKRNFMVSAPISLLELKAFLDVVYLCKPNDSMI